MNKNFTFTYGGGLKAAAILLISIHKDFYND